MIKIINLGNEKSALEILQGIKVRGKAWHDIRITNSHITELNKIIGSKVFKKDAVYISYQTLWEIMQPVGGKNKHNHHGLTPQNVFDALNTMHLSTDISISYDNRYIVVTLATVFDGIKIAVIVSPSSALENDLEANVTKIITIYPYHKRGTKKMRTGRGFCAHRWILYR